MGETVTKWAVIKKDHTVENLRFDFLKGSPTLSHVLDQCCSRPDDYVKLIRNGEVLMVNFRDLLVDYNDKRRDIAATADRAMATWLEMREQYL